MIARCALGFPERMTAELKGKVAAVEEKLILEVGPLPGEGRGMTRKTRRRFGRLDGKMALHNGLSRFRQESFRSVWSDLKELALSSR